jgi:hypothetical protein
MIGLNSIVHGLFRFVFSHMPIQKLCNSAKDHALDHDDFGLNQSKIMNVIDS